MIRFEDSVLVSSDFDGTIGYTHEPAPNGMTVARAYEEAIREHLGPEIHRDYLDPDSGGLRNRAPAELIRDLMPDAHEETQRAVTEALIVTKLGYLLDQVGTRLADGTMWPRVAPGFPETWEELYRLQDREVPVNTAIISSGHRSFIQSFFKVHGLELPNFMVTDDDMRHSHLSVDLRTKPSPLLMKAAQRQWTAAYGLSMDQADSLVLAQRTLYVGDDPIKDGELAQNSAVEFIHIPLDNPVEAWQKVGLWVMKHAEVTSAPA